MGAGSDAQRGKSQVKSNGSRDLRADKSRLRFSSATSVSTRTLGDAPENHPSRAATLVWVRGDTMA